MGEQEELSFEFPGGGHALFTTRTHGNLSTATGEDHERGQASRERLRISLGASLLAHGRQVHGAAVRRVKEGVEHGTSAEADGQATAMRRVGVMVLTADCLPVALGGETAANPAEEGKGDGHGEGAVAVLHAGWRGLAGGVLEQGVRALGELHGGGRIGAVIGPGAGACCYEVGEEVHATFDQAHRQGQRIDLRAIARERLLAAGVVEVRDLDRCTICDPSFFSHRREGAHAGRQAGVAWLD